MSLFGRLVHTRLLHHLTHHHITVDKPDVGEIVMCRAKLSWVDWHIHVRPNGSEWWHRIDGAKEMSRIIAADSADELRTMLEAP